MSFDDAVSHRGWQESGLGGGWSPLISGISKDLKGLMLTQAREVMKEGGIRSRSRKLHFAHRSYANDT